MKRNKRINTNNSNNPNGKRKKNKFKKILIVEIILLIIALVALYLVFVVQGKFNKIQRTEQLTSQDVGVNDEVQKAEEQKPKVQRPPYETMVLFGVDSRKNQLLGGTNSDVMMIVSIDNVNKQIRLASVYRDTYMDNARDDGVISLKRANSAYIYGYKRAISMLNRNLDLNITSYATASFAAVTKAVDALGGIDLDITNMEARQINRYLKETSRVAKVPCHFLKKGGHVHLDGAQATTYARIRKMVGDDFSRANRQRIVIKKMFEKAKSSDWVKVNNALDQVLPMISTNLSNGQIISYLEDLVSYDIVDTKAFPFELIPQTVNHASVLVPINLSHNVEQLHRYLYPTITDYTPSKMVQEISYRIKAATGVGDSTKGIEVHYYNGEDANQVGNSLNTQPQDTAKEIQEKDQENIDGTSQSDSSAKESKSTQSKHKATKKIIKSKR